MLREQEPYKLSLQITQHNEQIEVRAEAPGGQARSESVLLSDSIVSQTVGIHPRKLSQSDVDEIGLQLYKLLINGEVGKLVFDALEDGKLASQSLFLELRFDADQISLTKYPWELIRNELGQCLVRESLVDLTRCITYPQPMPVLRDDIRDASLLRIISRPPTLSAITTVELAIKNIETIDHAAFSTLQNKLLIEKVNSWGLQFDGHGALLLRCPYCRQFNELTNKNCTKCSKSLSTAKQVGVLVFENNGDVDFVATDEFGSVLYNSGVQLAMLLSCESARGGDESIFSSLASNLILSGVPAVLGMQYPVLDSFANSFANTFYTVLLETGSLLKAVRSARRMNIRGEWYNPAVYLRYKPSKVIPPVYETRQVDTATPSEVIVEESFLVGLWIRRPSTPQLSQTELRKQLCVSDEVEVIAEVSETDIKFERVEGKKIRRGEITVKIQTTNNDEQSRILFVDENQDAPPAIFVVKAPKTGKMPILFSAYQEERMIVSVPHVIEVVNAYSQKGAKVATTSTEVPVEKEELSDYQQQAFHRKLNAEVLGRAESMMQQLHHETGRNHAIENKFLHLMQSRELRYGYDSFEPVLEELRYEMSRSDQFEQHIEQQLRKELERIQIVNKGAGDELMRLFDEWSDSRERIILLYQRIRNMGLILYLPTLLAMFQICPMMEEPSVIRQMRHFAECGQCISYIKVDPAEVKLHPLLNGFLKFCAEKDLFDIDRNIKTLHYNKDDFKLLIGKVGNDLFKAFELYLEQTPLALQDDYLQYKKKFFNRRNR